MLWLYRREGSGSCARACAYLCGPSSGWLPSGYLSIVMSGCELQGRRPEFPGVAALRPVLLGHKVLGRDGCPRW